MNRTNEEQRDLFAALIEPAADIMSDKQIAQILQGGGKKITAVKLALKNHKPAIIEILAHLDGVEPTEYKVPNPLTLTAKIIQFLNNPEVVELFTSQEQTSAAAASGFVTESTGDGAN